LSLTYLGVKHHFIGLHGLAADNIKAFRIITANGRTIDQDNASVIKGLSLFKVPNGTGLGYGVVTSITMKVYPLSNLGMAWDGE
jgi:FAD/FMN-containing dehydrogenase